MAEYISPNLWENIHSTRLLQELRRLGLPPILQDNGNTACIMRYNLRHGHL